MKYGAFSNGQQIIKLMWFKLVGSDASNDKLLLDFEDLAFKENERKVLKTTDVTVDSSC